MKIAPLFAGALLACSAMAATAAELSLFGKELRTVDRAALRTAAEAAGAKLLGTNATNDRFNVDAVGVPGARELEVVYLNDKVVMAQYTLQNSSPTDEDFRKMLVSKYGQPTSSDKRLGASGKFDGQYIGDGKYRWKFDNGMELVFTLEFFGGRYLTYVNKPVQKKIQQLLDSAAQKQAALAAQAKSHAF